MPTNDYVTPPKKTKNQQEEYVTPPKKTKKQQEDYVTPPKKTEKQQEEYVTPPKKIEKQQGDYVTLPKKVSAQPEKNVTSNLQTDTESNDTSRSQPISASNYDSKYFETPKVSVRFYYNTYLFFSLLILFYSADANLLKTFFYGVYILLSNYTYSWFADYLLYKGNILAQLFTLYRPIKMTWGSSQLENYQTESMNKGLFSIFRISTCTDNGGHQWLLVILILVFELIKYVIVIPVALITIFMHKSTIKKYKQLVDQSK
ncbi:hypothetical protein JDW15_10155 [Aerococcaceae bacterium zg-ZJ1578]|uniref:hypothetical protein n=1 Tax=Aerococcaceae bacterium zg-252 TaxID=2796928 RepID=UPI001A2AF560|nr:hypothetical protein [Aerococcaceae bacterium zg-1578]